MNTLEELLEAFHTPGKAVKWAMGFGWQVVKHEDEIKNIYNSHRVQFEIIDVVPYDMNTFYADYKLHGPFLEPIHIKPKVLKQPITITEEGIYLEKYSHINSVSYKDLLKFYKWEDSHPCGIVLC